MRAIQKMPASVWAVICVLAAMIGIVASYAVNDIPDRIFYAMLEVIPIPETWGDDVCRDDETVTQPAPDPISEIQRSVDFRRRLEERFFETCTQRANACSQDERTKTWMNGFCFSEALHSPEHLAPYLTEFDAFSEAKRNGEFEGSRMCAGK